MDTLFEPYQLGSLRLRNRVVMAPMTRARNPDGVPNALNALYYSQRASAGLIVTEGTPISKTAEGFVFIPGLYTPAQVTGWRQVTDAVHAQSGAIFTQLWHVGRVSHVSNQPGGIAPVSSTAQIARNSQALAQSTEALGAPTALVNNAAILGRSGPTVEASLEEWKRVFDVNVFGGLLCAQAVVPSMVSHGYGRVVNVASIAGKEGNPFAGAYAASKAALISMTKSLGKELAETGVLVNCITPSAADTDIFGVYDDSQRAQLQARLLERVPMKRFVRVEEVAEMAAWLCSARCSFSTGAVFDISGGRAVY